MSNSNKYTETSKAYKIYSPKLKKYIHTRKAGRYIWERKSYAVKYAVGYARSYNIPYESLEILEYTMSYDSKKDLSKIVAESDTFIRHEKDIIEGEKRRKKYLEEHELWIEKMKGVR